MKKKLIALLAALHIKPQFANAAEPTESETEAAIDQAQAKVAEFANEQTIIRKGLLKLCGVLGITFANEAGITNPAATIAQAEEKLVTLNTDLTAARTAITTAQTSFANERTARIADEIALAITTGRITDAEKTTWEGRLKVEAQFANERTAIRALAPKVKTTSVTLKRGDREVQIDVNYETARREFINEVSSEIATEMKLNPVRDAKRIYSLVQQRHPALFKDVPHVAIKLPGGKR